MYVLYFEIYKPLNFRYLVLLFVNIKLWLSFKYFFKMFPFPKFLFSKFVFQIGQHFIKTENLVKDLSGDSLLKCHNTNWTVLFVSLELGLLKQHLAALLLLALITAGWTNTMSLCRCEPARHVDHSDAASDGARAGGCGLQLLCRQREQ